MQKIERSTMTMLDRWNVNIVESSGKAAATAATEESEPGTSSNIPFNIINNYFSIGVDAAICCKFHLEREKNPQKFNNRMKNKLWYFEYATSETFSSSCKNLHENIELIVSRSSRST